MKKSTSSQPRTLKSTLGIITLLIAAMTFNSCEKAEDMYPEQLSEGTFQNEQIKQMPDTKLSGQPLTEVDKINTMSQKNINPGHVAATNSETTQSINHTRTNMPTSKPKPVIEGTRGNQQIKQMPDTKLSGQPLTQVDKINTMSQDNINPGHVAATNDKAAQSISSEIKKDTEYRRNYPGYTTNMTTTIAVHPRD